MEPQDSREDEPQQQPITITGDEFAAVDVEAPIRESNKVDCWSLGDLYRAAASEQDEAGNATAARVFGLLSAIVQIHFKPEDRACQIAHATGWKGPEASRLKALDCAVIGDAVLRQDHRGFFNSGDVALQFAIDDDAMIAANAETFAASENVYPQWFHDLWDLAARAHSALRNQQDCDRCLVRTAESLTTIADAAGGRGWSPPAPSWTPYRRSRVSRTSGRGDMSSRSSFVARKPLCAAR